MVNYRYLGYGITNEQGIATLDHDAQGNPITHSYTGTGAGELDIIASLDDNTHISESSIQSEIYEIIDCTYVDRGTSASSNDIWYNQANTKMDRYPEYTELTENGGNIIYRLKSTNAIPKNNMCAEFDIYQVDGTTANGVIGIFSFTGNLLLSVGLSALNMDLGSWNHIKLKLQGNTVIFNDSVTRTLTGTVTDTLLLGFLTNGEITTVRFKNYEIYPI